MMVDGDRCIKNQVCYGVGLSVIHQRYRSINKQANTATTTTGNTSTQQALSQHSPTQRNPNQHTTNRKPSPTNHSSTPALPSTH
jgi:hypothetical protein